jgi:hypothetical protein
MPHGNEVEAAATALGIRMGSGRQHVESYSHGLFIALAWPYGTTYSVVYPVPSPESQVWIDELINELNDAIATKVKITPDYLVEVMRGIMSCAMDGAVVPRSSDS